MKQDDFHRAGVVHLVLCKRLKSHIDTQRPIRREELMSHKECEFGKWLYSEGLAKYPDLKELQELDKIHFDVHMLMRQIFEMMEKKDIKAAQQEYAKMDALSKKIITLLTTVGLKIGRPNK